jgi:hypothetical protein
MKTYRMAVAGLALITLAVVARPVAAAENPLTLVPAGTEFIAAVNVRQIVDSPLFQRLLEEKGGQAARAKLQVLQSLTGIALLKDLDRAVVWSRIKDDDSVTAVFQGRFDREKLLVLLKINPNYKETERNGMTVYEWFDQNEKRIKIGAFLDDGSILIANRAAEFDEALEARRGEKGFLATPQAARLPENPDQAGAWALLLKPERVMPNGQIKDTLRAESALLVITSDPTALHGRMRVHVDSPQTANDWLQLGQGLLALGRLQQNKPGLQKLAEKIHIALGEETNTVTMGLTLTLDELMGFAKIAQRFHPGKMLLQ